LVTSPHQFQVIQNATKRNASFTAGNSAVLVTANPASSHAFLQYIWESITPASLFEDLYGARSFRRLHLLFSQVV